MSKDNNSAPQSNPEIQANADISEEQWNRYKSTYAPAKVKYAESVSHLDDQAYHDQAIGQVGSEIKAQYGPQTAKLGADVVMGKFGRTDYNAEANDIAQAGNKASLGVTNRYLSANEGLVKIGQGQAADTLKGMNDVASNSVAAQNAAARNRFDAQQGNQAMIGGLAGATVAAANHSYDRPVLARIAPEPKTA